MVDTYAAERLVRDIDALYRRLLAERAPQVSRRATSAENLTGRPTWRR